MRVRILPENLTDAVIEAGRVTPSRGSLPAVNCVLLETVEGRLRVTGTDLETAVSVYSGAMVEEEGRALIPAAMLGKTLKTFGNDGALDLETEGKHGLALSADGRAFKLAGQNPEDYPPVPSVDTPAFSVAASDLRLALGRVLGAVATDTNRPTLCTVNFSEQKGRLALAAADGYRLSVHEVDKDGEVPDINVPAATLRELARLLPKPKDETGDSVYVFLDRDAHNIRFAFLKYEVTAMLVQGTFPNYRQLIPTTYTASATVDTKALRQEVAAAAVLASQGAGIVRFAFGPGDALTLSSRAEEEGEFEATLPANVEGEGKIAFQSTWLDAFLRIVGTDTVTIQVTTPSAPGLFLPVGDPDYSQTIVPMFVQW